MHEHSKGNTQRKMLSEATRDTHYRNLRSWSKSTPQRKLKQMEDHRRLQAQWYDIPHDKHSWEAKHFLAGYYAGHPGDWRLRLQIHFGLHPSFYWANFYSTKTTTTKRKSWFKTYAFISCPWTHVKSISLWTGMLSIKNISAKSIRQMSTGNVRSLKCEVTRECQHPWQGQ